MNEQVFELRYKPNARILDYRGEIAEILSDRLELPRWQIGKDRLDIFDESRKHRCFVSHRSLGCVIQDSPTASYFPDQGAKFLRQVSTLDPIGDQWEVPRLGVRSRFGTSMELGFNELLARFMERYGGLTEGARDVLGGEVEDWGLTLEMRDEQGWFKIQVGPMEASQLESFMKERSDYPPVSMYADIDYALRDETLTVDEASRFLKGAARAAWARHERIVNLVSSD